MVDVLKEAPWGLLKPTLANGDVNGVFMFGVVILVGFVIMAIYEGLVK